MIPRAICEAAFQDAVAECDPAVLVREALGKLAERLEGPERIGMAIGKAAFAMARGAGPVARGVAVSNADDGQPLPMGWTKMIGSHPVPDERSLEAGDAVIALIASARAEDKVIALVSGGGSALVERLLPGITLDQFRADISAVMASGASIREINRARIARSAIKGGKLAAMSEAPVTTLAISDVFDNDLAIIGSGPTIASEGPPWRSGDYARVIAPIDQFARSVHRALQRAILVPPRWFTEIAPRAVTDDVPSTADEIYPPPQQMIIWGDPTVKPSPGHTEGGAAHQHALHTARRFREAMADVFVAWGEPTVRLPADHGEGGRAQQLALELAKRMRGTKHSAFIVGSDGIDGPPPVGRPAPAGAYVDGGTWDAIAAAGLDPDAALVRCDAGRALDAAGALVVTGPTGINYADVMIVG